MKFVLIIFIVITFSSFQTNYDKFDEVQNEYKSEEDSTQLPNVRPMFIKDLSMIDESKFPRSKPDSILNLSYVDYKKLPDLIEVESFNFGEGLGKYFSNRTYSNDFKTYILCVWEGGDCTPQLVLMNVKGDSLLIQKVLWVNCGWEKGKGFTKSIFENDSTFTINYNGFDCDNGEPYISHRENSETYRIATNGGLILLNETKKEWSEAFNEKRWIDLMKN